MKKISRNVPLYCPICGNDQFESLDCESEDLLVAEDDVRLKCSDCGNIIKKEELLEENQEVINSNINDVKKEVVKEFEKELKRVLKKWK